MLKQVKKYKLDFIVGFLGYLILIFYLYHEYFLYRSMSSVINELIRPNPILVLFHFMILTAPIWSTILAYLIHKGVILQDKLTVANEQLLNEVIHRKKTIEELEKWQRLAIGREARMVELKEEIDKLKKD